MTVVILPLTIEAYDKMKLKKTKDGCDDLSFSDYLMRVLSAMPQVAPQTPAVVETVTAPTTATTPAEEGKDLEQQVLSHFDETHRLPSDYTCSCGTVFSDLSLFVKHASSCLSPSVSLGASGRQDPKKVRASLPTTDQGPRAKRDRQAQLECDICLQTFHTESTKYLHSCQKKPRLSERTLAPPTTMAAPPTPMAAPPPPPPFVPPPLTAAAISFTCMCGQVFTEYGGFIGHQTGCPSAASSNRLSAAKTVERAPPTRMVPNERGEFVCGQCEKAFLTTMSLKQHMEGMHRGSPKFICPTCGRGYPWCSSYHYHIKKCGKK